MSEMKQQLSVLMDNELDVEANQHLLIVTSNTYELKQCWREYHLIGDVLRQNTAVHLDIKHKVMERLANEPITFAPPRRSFGLLGDRYMTSMVASVAAVGFVAWVVWQSQAVQNQSNPVQNNQNNIVQNSSPQNMLTAESFDHYMLAHHEYASGNTLQRDMQLTSYAEANR